MFRWHETLRGMGPSGADGSVLARDALEWLLVVARERGSAPHTGWAQGNAGHHQGTAALCPHP
jgi:hypothetical protein